MDMAACPMCSGVGASNTLGKGVIVTVGVRAILVAVTLDSGVGDGRAVVAFAVAGVVAATFVGLGATGVVIAGARAVAGTFGSDGDTPPHSRMARIAIKMKNMVDIKFFTSRYDTLPWTPCQSTHA